MLPFHEKILFLFAFVLLGACHINLLSGIWILAGIEHNGRECHRGRCQILHLLKGEVEATEHLCGEGFHIALVAAGVRGDKVRDKLVAQVMFAADAVKVAVQRLKEGERRLTHKVENAILGMFGGNL